MISGTRRAVLGEHCGVLCDSCGLAELARRDADGPLEMRGELTLVRESGVRGDLREREIVALAEELLRAFDPAGNDVLVRRQSDGRLELPREGECAGVRGLGDLRQQLVWVEVFLDVLDHGVQLSRRGRALRAAGRVGECG